MTVAVLAVAVFSVAIGRAVSVCAAHIIENTAQKFRLAGTQCINGIIDMRCRNGILPYNQHRAVRQVGQQFTVGKITQRRGVNHYIIKTLTSQINDLLQQR